AGFLDKVKKQTDIVALIGQGGVTLEARGNEYWGLSPFIQETTASFHVRPASQDFHCFATDKHGDAIDWVQFHHNCPFVDAVKYLAERANMEIPAPPAGQPVRDHAQQARRKAAQAAAQFCMSYFQDCLKQDRGQAARTYLKNSRGVQDPARFGLGFCPPGDALQHAASQAGHTIESLLDAGVMRLSERNKKHYPIFGGRLVLPIRDRRSRPVGFAGRVLDGEQSDIKYLNSPATLLFDKKSVLYGADTVRFNSRKGDLSSLILVEGYFDTITLQEAGFPAVASMGTAVTQDQLEAAWSMASTIITCLDGNQAGQIASERVLDGALPLLDGKRRMSFVTLPADLDPDAFYRQDHGVGFDQALKAAEPLSERILNTVRVAQRVEDRVSALDRARACLSALTDKDWRTSLAAALQEADLCHRASLSRLSDLNKGSLTSLARLRIRNRLQDTILLLVARLSPEDLRAALPKLPPLDPAYDTILAQIVADPTIKVAGKVDLVVPHPGLDAPSLLDQSRNREERNRPGKEAGKGRDRILEDLRRISEQLRDLG
ncbi:MAG TPA: DNA primase, partial [Rhodospirillaceae bacterium]|nr:DNA primase [Rhodospirillaceae bacterium]